MQIELTNKQLFFALDPIWVLLDFRFKYQINQLVLANGSEDYVQSISVDKRGAILIYQSLCNAAFGRVGIGAEILKDLELQLKERGNYADYMAYIQSADTDTPLDVVVPDEYTDTMLAVDVIKASNAQIAFDRISAGKCKIIA